MSDIPDPAADEISQADQEGMPENFPGAPKGEFAPPLIDPEADALARQLDNAPDPAAAIEAGAGGDTNVDQAGVKYSPNLETPLSDAEIFNAAANGAGDLDLGNASDEEIYGAALRDFSDRSATQDDLDNLVVAEPDDDGVLEGDGAGLEGLSEGGGSDLPVTSEEQYMIDLGAKKAAAIEAYTNDRNPTNKEALEKIVALEALLQADKTLDRDPYRTAEILRLRGQVDGAGADVPAFLRGRAQPESVSGNPNPEPGRPGVEPAQVEADPSLAPSAVEVTDVRPGGQTGAERLAAIRSQDRITRFQRREARELAAQKKDFDELHLLGDSRDPVQDALYNEMLKDWGSTVEDAQVRSAEAAPLEKSNSQNRLEELRDKEASENGLSQTEGEELNKLEDSQNRYNELMDKDDLKPEERAELAKLSAEWGDPELRAAENEILRQTEKSLSSPEAFANFAKALEMYAFKKSGENVHKAVRDGLATAITEYFARKSTELNSGELRALKQVQELLKGMQQEVVVIMTYKKQLEAQVEAQKKLVKKVKEQQRLVEKNGDMEGDDQKKQRDALLLTAYYNKLAVMNANIILTVQKAQDANFNFAWKHRRVKKALGVGGGYFNDVAIFGDQIRRLARWADRQSGSVGTSLPLAEPLRSSRLAAKA